MALKDIGRGYGDLPSQLTHWFCPDCKKPSRIEDWPIVTVQLGPDKAEGRKAPCCGWIMSQVGDTDRALEADLETSKKIKERVKQERDQVERARKAEKVK